MTINFKRAFLMAVIAGLIGAVAYGVIWQNLRPSDAAQTAARIRTTYLKNLGQLSVEKQGHVLVRLYRTSGDPQWIPKIESYAQHLVAQFREHARKLKTPGYAHIRGQKMLKLPEHAQAKHINRAKVLEPWAEMIFATRLAFLMTQIQSFGLAEAAAPEFEESRGYLGNLPWAAFLLNPEVIRAYASRISNTVYYLKDLGLADLEAAYSTRFREAFDDPAATSAVDLLNEIYGLTHIIIADSGYYQRTVDAAKHGWILEDFKTRLPEIMQGTTPDVVAEVAVCFRLAGRHDDPVVKAVQAYLMQRFDRFRNIIPSSRGKRKSLDRLEHRNILAYMALADYKGFYSGPALKTVANDKS